MPGRCEYRELVTPEALHGARVIQQPERLEDAQCFREGLRVRRPPSGACHEQPDEEGHRMRCMPRRQRVLVLDEVGLVRDGLHP